MSHIDPFTPGLHGHCPLVPSQISDNEPMGAQLHTEIHRSEVRGKGRHGERGGGKWDGE